MTNYFSKTIRYALTICFSLFFVAGIVAVASPVSAATGVIDVKVLGIYENGPVVGGTALEFANGTQVTVTVLNTDQEVVGTAMVPIMNGYIGPRLVPSELLAGMGYKVHSEVLSQIGEILAVSNDDIFRSLGVTNVNFYNMSPTSAQISITSFGGDEGQDFGLFPVGEPGRSARLRYKPFMPGIFGEILYQFLPENYIDFPLGEGPSPGQTIQQILLGLTPNTTYSYKVVLSPLDEDENGLNDNYQTFVFPRPQLTDFIYSETDGPLLWGGLNGSAMPTFTTPNIGGGGFNGGGGGFNGGGNNGNGTGGQNGGTGGNNGGTQTPAPSLTVTSVVASDTSVIIGGTIENIPTSYTTTIYISLTGALVGDGTPISTGPGPFSVTIGSLTPNTTYQYHFASRPADPMSQLQPIIFHNGTFHFSTTGTNSAPVTVVGGNSGTGSTTTTGTSVPAGSNITSNPNISLVPCTGVGTSECTFQKLMEMINRIINFVLFILILPIAAIIFAYAGILYISSAASPSNKEKAKGIFGTVVVGLIVALGAWIIINTILSSFGIGGSSTYSWLGLIGN